MKKLDLTPVTDAAQMPVKRGTLQFLQDANAEIFNAIVRGAIGTTYDNSKVYILFGCVNTGDGNSYNISAGAVFYQGEVYLVDAAVFSTTGANTAVFTQVTTQYVSYADPVTFTDSSVHNIHNIRKMVISSGASGSGIANWADRANFNFTVVPQLNPTAAGIMQISGTYPNLVFNVPDLNQNTESGVLELTKGAAVATSPYSIKAWRVGKTITIAGQFQVSNGAALTIASIPVATLAPGLTLSNKVYCRTNQVDNSQQYNRGVVFFVDTFNPNNKTTINLLIETDSGGDAFVSYFSLTFVCA